MLKVKLIDESRENSPKRITIGIKRYVTPHYAQEIGTPNELQIAQETKRKFDLQNSSLHVIGLNKINEILTKRSQTLHKFIGSSGNMSLSRDYGLIIDPSFEYLLHKVKSEREEALNLNQLPKSIAKILKGDDYGSKISALMKSSEKVKIVDWAMTLPMEEYGALFPLPPSLPIQGTKSLEWSMEINRLGITTALDNGWHEAMFFNFDSSKCFREEILRPLLAFIKMNQNDVNTIVLKFARGIRPTEPLDMSAYFSFMEGLKNIRKDKAVILLNTDSFGFINMGLYFADIFAEPINGTLDKDIRRKKTKSLEKEYDPYRGFGRWLNPKDLLWWKSKSFKTLVKNNGHTPPCHCFECNDVDIMQMFNESYEYNRYRKRHAILVRNEQMEQLRQNMMDNNLRGAMFDKLKSTDMMHSQFSQYRGWFS